MQNCLKKAETSIVLIVFNDIICDVSAYMLLFLSVALSESGTRNALLSPWLNNTEVYLTPFISTQHHTIAG